MQNTTSYGHRKNSTIIKLELLLTKLRVQSPKSCLPLIEIENHNNNKAPSPNHFLITCRINTSWPTKSLQKGLCYICVYYSESRNLALQRDDSNGVRIVTIGQYERFQFHVRRYILSMVKPTYSSPEPDKGTFLETKHCNFQSVFPISTQYASLNY